MKKMIGLMMIALFVSFLFTTAGTAFAKPPEDKASKSQACNNASANGKAHANANSALGSCDAETPAPAPEPEGTNEPDQTTTTTTTTTEPQPSATCDGSDPFNPACM